MPIYEYVCAQCGSRFDEIRAMMSADESITCAHCQSGDTKRVLSNFYAHNASGAITASPKNCSGCTSNACSTCRI